METSERKQTFKWLIITLLKTVGFTLLTGFIELPLIYAMTRLKAPVVVHWIVSILVLAINIFSVWWLWGYYKKHTSYQTQKMGLKDIGIAVGYFVLGKVIFGVFGAINQAVTGYESSSNQAGAESVFTDKGIFPLYIILFCLSAAFVAPIVEEVIFRGILTELWSKKDQKWLPAVVSSAAFSWIHGYYNPITFLMYFLLGVTFFFAYNRRHNIKDPILVHFLNNGLAATILLIKFLTS